MADKLRKVGVFTFYTIILLLISNLGFGVYFGYDSIGATHNQLESERRIKGKKFGALYSAYALPNIFTPVINGVLVDRVGVNTMSILLSILVISGSSLVALVPSFTGMMFGRVIYGLGSESLLVCQQTMLSTWFRDGALNFAFGLNTAWVQVASAVSYIILPAVSVTYGLNWALWTAVFANLYSFVCNIIYVLIQFVYKKYWASGSFIKMNDETEYESSKFQFMHILKFPLQYWCLAMQSLFISSSIYTFVSFGPQMLMSQYKISEDLATQYMSLINFLVTLAPISGLIIDRVGRKPLIFMVCCIIYIICFLALIVTPLTRDIATAGIVISVMGLTFSITESSLYASVSTLVDEKVTGTAYGVLACIYNTGLFVTPLIVALIEEETNKSNSAVLLYYAGNMTLAAIFGFIWMMADRRKKKKHRKKMEVELKEIEMEVM